MTTTTIRTAGSTNAVPGPYIVKTVADSLLQAMTDAGFDAPHWESAGPLVSAAAQRLREALGTPVNGACVSVSAVVREADFAIAARPLLVDAPVVDFVAAREFVQLAGEAQLALS